MPHSWGNNIVEIRRGFSRYVPHQPNYLKLYEEYLIKEALVEVAYFKIGGMIIRKLWFSDDKDILAKTQKL